jgi:hypothetical protein
MNRIVCVVFFCGVLFNIAADGENTSSLRIGISPALGYYRYEVQANTGVYDGGLNSLSLEYAYRLSPSASIIAYTELSGHLYSGHENSSHPVARYWGLINSKTGGGIRLAYPVNSNLELSLGTGAYYVLYIHNLDSKWSGLGANAKLSAFYALGPRISLGLSGSVSGSYHPGGPEPNMPGLVRYSFSILEYGIGIGLGLQF